MTKVQTMTNVTITFKVSDNAYGDYDEAFEAFSDQFFIDIVDETPCKGGKTAIEIQLTVKSEDYKAYEEALDNFANSFEHSNLETKEEPVL